MTQDKSSGSGSDDRVAFEIRDVDQGGVLVDVLERLLDHLSASDRLCWSVFDLEWVQNPHGILHAERVIARSRTRPKGLRLDDHGIRLFREYTAQIIDGVFFSAPHFIDWPSSSEFESVLRRSSVALKVFDSTYWHLSCRDGEFARKFVAQFAECRALG